MEVNPNFSEWIPVSSGLPKKMESSTCDHIPCVVATTRSSFPMLLLWNCYYEVWDDSEGDDISYYGDSVTHYIVLPKLPMKNELVPYINRGVSDSYKKQCPTSDNTLSEIAS